MPPALCAGSNIFPLLTGGSRRSVGITVIGGMSVATLVGVLFIPFCYYLVARIRNATHKLLS